MHLRLSDVQLLKRKVQAQRRDVHELCLAAAALPAVATPVTPAASSTAPITLPATGPAAVADADATTAAARAATHALQGPARDCKHDQAARLWRSQLLHHGLVLATQE